MTEKKEGTSKYKVLASNSLLFFIGNIGSKFITFFLVPLYTNALTRSEYGSVDLITTSVILCIPLFSLSIDDAILRFGLKKDVNRNDLFCNILYVLLGSSITIGLLSPLVKKIGFFDGYEYYFCVILILQIARNAFSIYMKSVNKVKVFAIDSILYSASLCILNILFLIYYKLGIRGYLLSIIFSIVFSLIIQTLYGNLFECIKLGKFNKTLLSDMLKYSTPLIISAVSWWIINSSDRYMLSFFMGKEAVGLYTVSYKIPNFLAAFTSVFSAAWMISSITEYENKKSKKFYSNVFSMYIAILSFGAIGIMLVLKLLMRFYVEDNYYISWKYVPYLLVAAVCGTCVSFFTPIFKAEFQNIKEVILIVTGATVNILVNAILIPVIGIQGASIGTLVAEGIMFIICIYETRKFFKFYINFYNLVITMLLLIINAAITASDFKYQTIVSVLTLLILLYLHRTIFLNIMHSIKGKITRKGVRKNE